MALNLLRLLSYAAMIGTGHAFNATELFGPHVSPGTKIATYGDTDFDGIASPRWSTWEEPSFQAVIKPVTEVDVQNIVTVAANNSIPFLAVNTGHGTALGYGDVKHALNINLGNFNSVTVEAENNLLHVGGGVKFGDIFQPLYDAGKELQTGNTECVGLVGATIGGGIGTTQGLHGLILDALVSVRVVTASGALVTASATENSDLFWAVRGAGANFGIITQATYNIYDQTNDGYVSMGQFVYPASSNSSLWDILHSFDDYLPRKLSLIISAGFNHTTGLAFLTAGAFYHGPMAEAQPYFDQFIAEGPVKQTILNVTTLTMFSLLSQGPCNDGQRHNDYTIGLNRTDVATFTETFADWVNFVASIPSYTGLLVFQRYSNEVMLQKPSGETSYPWRDIKTYLLLDNIYANSSLDSAVDGMSDSVRSKLQTASGFNGPHVYVNYDHGDEGAVAKYGPSVGRLRGLKAKWDPLHLFGTPNPLY